jgi:hypothetical protein
MRRGRRHRIPFLAERPIGAAHPSLRLVRCGQGRAYRPPCLCNASERLIGVVALDIAEGGQIQTVTSVINPDKLRHLGPLADLGPLSGRRGGAGRGPAGPPA